MSSSIFLLSLSLTASVVLAGNVDVSDLIEGSVCYDKIGCFETGEPWSSLLRPIPPPAGPDKNPATVYCYTREDPLKSYTITTYPEINMGGAPFDGQRPTVVIVHGHSGHSSDEWMHTLKDVYLKRLDANVLLTDWAPGAAEIYPVSVSDTRVVARLVARLLKHLMEFHGLTSDRIHLIGHSLGAQVVSYIGKETPYIGRLTALEPAQPLYEGYDSRVALHRTDANFVEVVHTNAKLFALAFGRGTIRPSGDVDFYFNGGGSQPACVTPENIPNITNPVDAMLFMYRYNNYTGLCSHEQAYRYLIEAYNRTNDCVFYGHRAIDPNGAWSFTGALWGLLPSSLPLPNAPDSISCRIDECIPFGLETIDSPLRGVFTVRTRRQSPYCIPKLG